MITQEITGVDIHTDRINLIVHLADTESNDGILFWILPKTNDESVEWETLQRWLDDGNKITDSLPYKELYRGERGLNYPSWQEQADMAYWDRKNGTTTLDDAIQAVKDAHPKPTVETK